MARGYAGVAMPRRGTDSPGSPSSTINLGNEHHLGVKANEPCRNWSSTASAEADLD